ncbi:hypothetical protein SLS60_008486 [Paraconiothyrium brasiliense]|uniref:Uncharacterized protein n=1 Tax=Paraconiothyrium brasiliense TaxID=300254 RepID=A0ABR3R0P7_9PLEO
MAGTQKGSSEDAGVNDGGATDNNSSSVPQPPSLGPLGRPPSVNIEASSSRGVRRDASQLGNDSVVGQSSIAPHGGIAGIAGHYARAAPQSSFTSSGGTSQYDYTPHGLPSLPAEYDSVEEWLNTLPPIGNRPLWSANSFSASGWPSYGGTVRMEPGSSPSFIPSFASQQFMSPSAGHSSGSLRSHLVAPTQRGYQSPYLTNEQRSGSTGYTLPPPSHILGSNAPPILVNPTSVGGASSMDDSASMRRALDRSYLSADMIPHTSTARQPSTNMPPPPVPNRPRQPNTSMPPPPVPSRPRSNLTQYPTIGRTPETFISPYPTHGSIPSSFGTSSRESPRVNPRGRSRSQRRVGALVQRRGRSRRGHAVDTSPLQRDEDQGNPSLTSRNQPVALADQQIVATYDEYHAPVVLYEIVPETTGCYYAQGWLENHTSAHSPSPTLLPQNVSAPNIAYRFYHGTQGFINTGNALSLLVLHNATDPWDDTFPPRPSTTTIGTYGYHHFEDDWIHWITFTPGLKTWLTAMENAGYIKKISEWTKAMQPRERRFHKAYWMAANRMEMGNLLRRAPLTGGMDPNAVDDDEFPHVTKDNLDTSCGPVNPEDTVDAYDVVMGVAQGIGAMNFDHIVAGDPEAPLYDQLLQRQAPAGPTGGGAATT